MIIDAEEGYGSDCDIPESDLNNLWLCFSSGT